MIALLEQVKQWLSPIEREYAESGSLPLSLQPEGNARYMRPETAEALRKAGRRYPVLDSNHRILEWKQPGTSPADMEARARKRESAREYAHRRPSWVVGRRGGRVTR